MTEDDFRDLLELVRRELNALGLGEIAEDYLYRVHDDVDELLPPNKHLIRMLEQAKDWLALLDSSTVKGALSGISEATLGAPRGAELVLPGVEGQRRVDLLDSLPELSGLRARLGQIIGQLQEARPEPRSGL